MKYTQIPSDTFQKLAMNAGIIASDFTPSTGTLTASDIIGATSGGTTVTVTPEFADMGEDIDNCPKNTKELKKITGYTVTASGTFVTVSSAVAKKLMAGSVVSEIGYVLTSDTAIVSGKTYYTRTGSGTEQSPYVYTPVSEPNVSNINTYYEQIKAKITPTHDLDPTASTGDFGDIWIIGDYSDKNGATNGGFVACHILNALSTGGFSFVTSDGEKAKFAFEFTGHYSINSPEIVPFELYVHAGAAEPT